TWEPRTTVRASTQHCHGHEAMLGPKGKKAWKKVDIWHHIKVNGRLLMLPISCSPVKVSRLDILSDQGKDTPSSLQTHRNYDHSCCFMAMFITDQLRHHAKELNA
ncbi:hypothetical protein E2I00_010437, partial [Balaenoptera physalus]